MIEAKKSINIWGLVYPRQVVTDNETILVLLHSVCTKPHKKLSRTEILLYVNADPPGVSLFHSYGRQEIQWSMMV